MKRRVGVLISLLGMAISWIIRIYLMISQENLIIVYGIQKYRNYGLIATISALCFSVLAILMLFLSYKKVKTERIRDVEQKVFIEEQQQAAIEEKRQQTSFLSANNMLKESVIRDNLKYSYEHEWSELRTDLLPLYDQSKKMDKLQERLKTLITKNDASVLDDTEDVLEQAEQGLLQNIRKVMNYMDVCDPTVPEEKEKVRNSAVECLKNNKQIIDNVSDFLMSLTEYLNNQGSKDNLNALNTYKEALMGSIPNANKEVEKVSVTL